MKFRECGSFPEFMEPSYPSKTFPNHHTLMTGLYPGQHGIVANKWYDWKKDANCNVFNANTGEHPCNVSSPEEGWWSGDPFWNTVERHDMISASCLWAGNDITINGEQPTYFWDYKTYGEEPFGYRIYQMLKWLNLPAYPGSGPKEGFRPKFLTLYFDEPDHIGHGFGPYDSSGELDAALKRVDFQLQQLMDGLKIYNLDKCVNIVLTTDHGMEQALCEDMVATAPVFDEANPEIMKTTNFLTKTTTAQMGGLMGSNRSDSFDVMEVINTVKCTWHGNSFKVWDKYVAPKRLHYDNASPAIEVLLFYMKREAKITAYPLDSCTDEGYMGNHGWDTKYGGMKVPLTLYGPKIRPNVVLPPIQNVEVFRLLMDLIGIKSDSPNLMPEFYDSQFSLDGRFEPALKRPTNPAKPPAFSGDVAFPAGVRYNKSLEIAFDENHKFATYAKCTALGECFEKLRLGFEENPMLEFFDDPYWWHTLKDDMLPRIFSNNVKSLRFGAAFDTTGTGVYVPPNQWMKRTENRWCNRTAVRAI
jgi:predicted AlkP superfamily pyrophosphatase or phosphodiesterase